MKKYAIEIMGKEEKTYATQDDVVKLVNATNAGAKLVLVGQTFINPSSISRIKRVYDIDDSVVDNPDEELIQALENPQIKRLKEPLIKKYQLNPYEPNNN